MNDEEHFRDLLGKPALDDVPRDEHRQRLCAEMLTAFDAARRSPPCLIPFTKIGNNSCAALDRELPWDC